MLGTVLGVALAGAIAAGLHPAGGATVVIVGLLAWAGYAVFPASFAVGFAFITALVVFLLNAVSPDTLATASARLLDTLVGGTIGLIAYAVWPTWARTPARQALARLVARSATTLGACSRAWSRAGAPVSRTCARWPGAPGWRGPAPRPPWRCRSPSLGRAGSTPSRARGCWARCDA